MIAGPQCVGKFAGIIDGVAATILKYEVEDHRFGTSPLRVGCDVAKQRTRPRPTKVGIALHAVDVELRDVHH